jgi:hypothetical protein
MSKLYRLAIVLAFVATASAYRSNTEAQPGVQPSLQRIANLITDLELEQAREHISRIKTESIDLALEKARLAIYLGDCDTAAAVLRAPELRESERGAPMANLATRCAMATAGALVVEEDGIWFRLQDAEDVALLPYLKYVIKRSHEQHEKDLGLGLPTPIRVDLVRDHFSLSALSGLPLEAAETTGTVAIARFGRVIMLSPRAAEEGYPWEDTVAHELSHLVVSRATRDLAPLWLQEGVAKVQETRWRQRRPFDDKYRPDQIALVATRTGQEVGLDQIGPSIAMLPSPQAAAIAFAEVASFIEFWSERVGRPALRLLLKDLKGLGPEAVDRALRSVSGYSLGEWDRLWRHELEARFRGEQLPPLKQLLQGGVVFDPAVSRALRLSDLLFERQHDKASGQKIEPLLAQHGRDAYLRYRAARALALEPQAEGAWRGVLGEAEALDAPHYGWFALKGRALREEGRPGFEEFFAMGRARHPLGEVSACEGHWPSRGTMPQLAESEVALCQAALRFQAMR